MSIGQVIPDSDFNIHFPDDVFDDASLMLARAQTHLSEFNKLSANFNISPRKDLAGNNRAVLTISRNDVRSLKPILADTATNLSHSLDNILAAFRRLENKPREYNKSWPKRFPKADFRSDIKKLEDYISTDKIEFIKKLRRENPAATRNLDVIRHIANDSKHWQLQAAELDVRGIGINAKGKQHMVQIPTDYFETHQSFDFEIPKSISAPESYVAAFSISMSGFDDPEKSLSPDFTFKSVIDYVERALAGAREFDPNSLVGHNAKKTYYFHEAY